MDIPQIGVPGQFTGTLKNNGKIVLPITAENVAYDDNLSVKDVLRQNSGTKIVRPSLESITDPSEDYYYLIPTEEANVYDQYIYSEGKFVSISTTKVTLGDYATKEELQDKQDKIVAGKNITIVGNTISVTGIEEGMQGASVGSVTYQIEDGTEDTIATFKDTDGKVIDGYIKIKRGENGAPGAKLKSVSYTQNADGDTIISFTDENNNKLDGSVVVKKGEKGDAFKYSDFTTSQLAGLKGPKGDQGIKGDKGDKGDPGADGTNGANGKDAHVGMFADEACTQTYTDNADHCYVATWEGDGAKKVSVDLMSNINAVMEALDDIMNGNY